jgi:ABC-type lipoprotein export system ATPase subunit
VSAPPAVDAVDLNKSFLRGSERVHAVRAVSFTLQPGEVVGLTGPSGSGKTTLLNVVCGWERPDSGEMRFAGDERSPADLMWIRISIVPQDLALFEELTIGDNVRLPIRLGGSGPTEGEVDALMEQLGILHLAPRLPLEASLGEQQRASLARAMVLGPSLLLADEPTGHQDEGWTKAVMAAIRSLAERGTACLVTTHDPDAMKYLDRRLDMRDGELRAGEFPRTPFAT